MLPPPIVHAGLAGLMPTEHPYPSQCFDVPPAKHPTMNHLGKPHYSQALRKCMLVRSLLALRSPRAMFSVGSGGNCSGCDPVGLVPPGTLQANHATEVLGSYQCLRVFIDIARDVSWLGRLNPGDK